ncbi:serine hydrolase domain-containing protein [Actinacidiphila oryziradicis]|uniref:serine hydrolase domain-containing protein n=2 Tax=Actinacidiphila oryziradicis TaxID=2571141 RepID=UPI001B804636|nr:serine hydrolase domain-containing protein [Actinacidiphila oryziradicis]
MPTPSPYEELLPETRRALLHRIAVAQSESRAPSLVAAVVRDGRTVWTGARSCVPGHEPDGDTQYRIGSITKTFAAVLVLRLRDEGLLDLTDPLGKHLDGTDVGEGTGVGELTVGQLLSHTAGLASESPGPWWERTPGELRPALADVLGEKPRLHPAGRRYHYSNPGFTLLGALVERLRGEPWGDVLWREVLEPLGMTRTTLLPQAPHAGGWAVHPWADLMLPEAVQDTGLMAPAGQLWSTTDDLARWAAFLAGGDDAVLSAGSVAEMREPAAPAEGGERAALDAPYGLGLQLLRTGGRTLAGHTGSMPGFVGALWVSVADGVGAVALANSTSGTGPVAADLLKLVAEREPRIPEPWRPLSDPDPALLALTGPWYWGPTALALRLREGRALELGPIAGSGRASRFRPEPDGTWTGLDGYYAGETLRAVRGPDGAVSHLDLGSFVLTRAPYDPAAPVPGGTDPGGWRAS